MAAKQRGKRMTEKLRSGLAEQSALMRELM